ncbi:MAG: dihydropteroate synthase [bacterium]
MIIIGERLNSARPRVCEAFGKRDKDFILAEARAQAEAGAQYIDINAAQLIEGEIDALIWAIELIQEQLDVGISIDTPNPKAMEAAIRISKGDVIMNSLTGESRRLDQLLCIVEELKPKVIVLCMDDLGIPGSVNKALDIARSVFERLRDVGIQAGDIFFDALIRPVSVDEGSIKFFLESLRALKKNLPDAKTVAGISNVSFGLPLRRIINRTLLTLAVENGLDAGIIDPLDKDMLMSLAATNLLLNRDPGCRRYISLARKMRG